MEQVKKEIHEDLKNMTVEDLKSKLDELGVPYELAKKPKKHYIELVENAVISNILVEDEKAKSKERNSKTKSNNLINGRIQESLNSKEDNEDEKFKNLANHTEGRSKPESSSRIKIQSLKLLNNKRERDGNTNISNTSNPLLKNNPDLASLVQSQQNLSNNNNVNLRSIIHQHHIISKSNVLDNSGFRAPVNVVNNSSNNYTANSKNLGNSNNMNKNLHYSSNKGLPNILNNNSSTNNLNITNNSHISSKSLKGLIPVRSMQSSNKIATQSSNTNILNLNNLNNTKNKLVNDAFNNVKIADYTSGVKPFSRSRSRTPSVLSGNAQARLNQRFSNNNLTTNNLNLNNNFSQSSLNGFNNLNIDINLLLQVASGTVIVYGLVYYLYKFQNTPNGIEQVFAHTLAYVDDNKKEVLSAMGIIAGLVFIWAVYRYLKTIKEYDDMCCNIALLANTDTVEYLKNLIEIKNQSFVEESLLISYLSEKYFMNEADFTKHVYRNYLKKLLEQNEMLCRKDLIENGDIKLYWIYDVDDDIEVVDNKLNDDEFDNNDIEDYNTFNNDS